MDFFLSVLSTTAVSAVLIAALAWLLRTWITERLKNAIRHEYDKDIEAYKSVLMHVQTATAEGQKAAVEARLQAFDRVWKAMLSLRSNTNVVLHYFDITTVEECETLKDLPSFQKVLGSLNDQTMIAMIPDADVEEVRPYVGELTWLNFFAYQAFNLRLIALAHWSVKQPDRINWHEDTHTRNILAIVLTAEELAHMDALIIGKVGYVRQVIEAKFIVRWNALISGKELGDEAMKQIQAHLALLSNWDVRTKKVDA